MKRATTFLSLLALSAGLLAQSSVKTERQYLSGRGCDDMDNGISCVPVVIIPENGRKSEYLLVGNCKDSVLINMA